jgi:hypothetical protein
MVQWKLVSLGLPTLEAEFGKMRADKGMMFKAFTREYTFSIDLDVQEAADTHLVLLCRYLTWLDDTRYKHLKAAFDLRNGCGHPTGYQPDPAKLQAYYADITQLVLLNPRFA